MALFERLLGIGTRPKINVHYFRSVLAEWARGNMTGAQANACIAAMSGERPNGVPLDAGEIAEAQALVDTVLAIPVSGSAASQADGRARRAMRVQEINDILTVSEYKPPGYSTPEELKAKLGVV